MKPGSGWRHVNGLVYDHDSGIRLHLGGILKRKNGSLLSFKRLSLARETDFYIKVNGGNAKRGLMAWALTK